MPMLDLVPLDRAKIRALREAKGWSLARAAREAGWKHGQQWHQVEFGKVADPSFSTVERMARALGVTVNDLVADEEAGQ